MSNYSTLTLQKGKQNIVFNDPNNNRAVVTISHDGVVYWEDRKVKKDIELVNAFRDWFGLPLIDKKKNFFCKIGIHDWEKWEDTKFRTEFRLISGQQKYCNNCKIRKVRINE